MKKLYYSLMYEIADSLAWYCVGDPDRWAHWWRISESYRSKRNNA